MMQNTSQTDTILIDPIRAQAMHKTLGHEGDGPKTGDPLPPFWHWGQFWTLIGPDESGRDGHPKLGGFIPDLGLPRRMWAGGNLRFERPLRIGQEATRTSRILNVTQKTGRTGPLAFVKVEHLVSSPDGPCFREEQDLVYREDPSADQPGPQTKKARTDETWKESYHVSTVDLFRYSALTFNGHRIHYDLDYAKEVEGYPGLVTHGPLLAQRLIEMAERHLDTLSHFSFQAVAPLFHFESFETCAQATETGLDLWVRGQDGRLNMIASAS